MKKIFNRSAIIFLVLLGFQACKPDEFLNTPAPSISDAAFFANDASVISALPGVYDPMGWYNSKAEEVMVIMLKYMSLKLLRQMLKILSYIKDGKTILLE
jgi:hypothetical protein